MVHMPGKKFSGFNDVDVEMFKSLKHMSNLRIDVACQVILCGPEELKKHN